MSRELNDHVANEDEGLDQFDEPDEDDFDDFGEGWCLSCGDPFHLDDTGGYNPPCSCGSHCRRCHEIEEHEDDEREDPDVCEHGVSLLNFCDECDA